MNIIPFSVEELELFRKDTPGCNDRVHFNNAGASLPPDSVVDTVVNYLRDEAQMGGYEIEGKYSEFIEDVYSLIARLIHAEKDEVAICENASAAWLTAFKGIQFEPGDEIITSELEYTSNLIALVDAKKLGVKVHVINNDQDGNFPLTQFENAISGRTKLIAVTHIPSSGGGMLPIEAIGEIAARHRILYLVDACQSVGQYPIDVVAIGCDILSATGRKYLRAPRGTGFLYVSKKVQDRIVPIFLDQHAIRDLTLEGYSLRSDARRFELYEKNRALTLGLGKAVEYALRAGVDRIWVRIQELARFTRNELRKIPQVVVHDQGAQQCGIVTFSVNGIDSMALRNALIKRNVNVSFSGPSATLIYMRKRGFNGLVRASLHYYNTEEEVEKFCIALYSIINLNPEKKA